MERLLGETRSKHFGDKIPEDHDLSVKLDSSLDLSHIMTTDGKTISVHPDALDLSDQSLAWVFGHELVHVSDIIKFGYNPGSIQHYRSEIGAYQWQLDHAKGMGVNLGWQDRGEIRGIMQDYGTQIKAMEIMNQFR